MPRSVRRRWVLPGLVLCAVLAGPIAAAQASDNDIRSTLNQYGPKIVKDENAVKKGIHVDYPQGKWHALVHALKHEISDLHALNKALKSETASSATGAMGKKDVIKGLGLIASAYGALDQDILAVHGGGVPASKVDAAVATDTKGIKKLRAGLHLLSS